jgi:hypothetical protein
LSTQSPAIIHVEEVVLGDVDTQRSVHHVEVAGLGRAENVEARDGFLGGPERRQRRLNACRRDHAFDSEQPVVRWIPLVQTNLQIAGQRHGVIKERNRRHLARAEEAEERHAADLVQAAPPGRNACVDAAADLPCAPDHGIERRGRAGVGCEIVAAPFGVVREIRAALHQRRRECDRCQQDRAENLAPRHQCTPRRAGRDAHQQDQKYLGACDDAM